MSIPRLALALAIASTLPFAAQAAVSVNWTSPANNSVFLAGTAITLTGSASATGTTGGTGLDLALVLDSSGSMTSTISGKTLQAWQKEAATALVNALPLGSTSVTVVEFDSDANTVRTLTSLNTNKAAVITAINSVDASGGTDIGLGINKATAELNGSFATAGRTQVQVVMSDGLSSGNPSAAAAQALLAGIDAVHAVGLPGHNATQMKNIALAGNGTYTNGTDVSTLAGLFSGTAGNLVGIKEVDLTLNDGTFLDNVAIDGLGNFVLPNITLALGDNFFTAVAYDSLGNSATSVTNMVGITAAVPEPATWAGILACLGVLGGVGARQRKPQAESAVPAAI
jgi:Ca-activated chloride channel homolog